MKKLRLALFLTFAAAISTSIVVVFAQGAVSLWPFFVAVTPSSEKASGNYNFVLPLQLMDKSREDLADLRLYESGGREIPYAIRVHKEVDDRREMGVNLFNVAKIGAASEASVDLGENAGEHNEVEINTNGVNFRRRVDVEGSETGNEWRTLRTGDLIFDFEAENRSAESNRISYPTSRYQFLRVRVHADEMTDKEVPVITSVRVMMAVREPGSLTTWNTGISGYQLLRNQRAPASSWDIDLYGRLPIDRLLVDVADQSFSRSFQIEEISDPQNIRLLATGELTRRIGEAAKPFTIKFENEEVARKLRLVVTDYSNPALTLTSIQAAAPTRELIYELKEGDGRPLRLFFGNPKAIPPHYDFEKQLQAGSAPVPLRSEVGNVVSNPDYKPEPLPLTERVPWLIYLVLAASSIALALILISLARTTLSSEPRSERTEAEVGG